VEKGASRPFRRLTNDTYGTRHHVNKRHLRNSTPKPTELDTKTYGTRHYVNFCSLKSRESGQISHKIDDVNSLDTLDTLDKGETRLLAGFPFLIFVGKNGQFAGRPPTRNRQKGLFRVGSHRLPYPEPPLPTVSPGSQGKRPPQMPCNRFLWPPHIPPWLRGEKAASGHANAK